MLILAIESSHDDTSIALVKDFKVVQELSLSQTSFHNQFGGTIPEYAARLHAQNFPRLVALMHQNFNLAAVDVIAYTALPGLTGSLQMGKLTAEALALALNKKLVAVNHLHAHIFAVGFDHKIIYPALALVVSGGHTQLSLVRSALEIQVLVNTSDDAAGEVFDKVARSLGLSLPGGPALEKLASMHKGALIDFSSRKKQGALISFSGLKTKVQNYIAAQEGLHSVVTKAAIAASFQAQIVDELCLVTSHYLALHPEAKSLILGGGVAANTLLRTRFAKLFTNALIPAKAHTTDSASMIALMAKFTLEAQGQAK